MHLIILLLSAMFSFALPSDPCEKALTETSVAHHHADLDTYIAGMEKSSLQKAAFGALGRPGRLVDLGAGSGVSAYDLALLFPDSKVVGVDLDPAMVIYAAEHYRATNLWFKVGNAQLPNFKPASLDTIFISSTMHHLTSYGVGHFDVGHAKEAIRAGHGQLKSGGVMIARDFVIADGPEVVLMELPTTDGAAEGSVPELSTAAMFLKFARDFRSSVHPTSGVPYLELKASAPGWRRFQLKGRDAGEFILRKDYRNSYDAEIKEEYTFMTKAEFETSMEEAGFRILHAAPIYNPWIVENRYRGKVRLTDLSGHPVYFPPTNFVIVGEKIDPGQGLRLVEAFRRPNAEPNFLRRQAVRDVKTGKVFDMVERPGAAVDLLPYFVKGKNIYVMAKQGYPRPLTTVQDTPLDGVTPQGYVIEPLAFLVNGDQPLFRQIETQMTKRGSIAPSEILSQGPKVLSNLYTSPGLVNEQVQTIAMPVRARAINMSLPAEDYSGFSTSGVVRSLEATQLLRSAQVGALLDARLELGVYQLLLSTGRSPGPWIGEEVKLGEAKVLPRVRPASEVLNPKRRQRQFAAAPEHEFGKYLEIRRSDFEEEEDATGKTINTVTLEYAVPKDMGVQVMSVLPVIRRGSKILVGLEHRQMPTVQMSEGTSDLIAAPGWRLPKSIVNVDQAQEFVQSRMSDDFGMKVSRFTALGGMYHPSKGVVPEAVYPFLAEVETAGPELRWVELSDLLASRHLIKDAHLMVVLMRAAHALGRL